MVFSPTAPILAVITSTDIQSWNLADPANPKRLSSWSFPVDTGETTGVFTPDGAKLIVGDDKPLLRIFRFGAGGSLADPAVVQTRAPYGNQMIAVSPDGRTVALAGPEAIDDDHRVVDVWDISADGRPRRSMALPVHVTPDDLAFTRDGQILIVKSGDEVDLWPIDPATVAAAQCRLAGDPITRDDWRTYVGDLPYDPPCPQP